MGTNETQIKNRPMLTPSNFLSVFISVYPW